MRKKHFVVGVLCLLLVIVACSKNEPATTDIQNFFYHILLGDRVSVEEELKEGFNPNVVNSEGLSALHYAIFIEHFEIAQLLLDYGAEYKYSKIKDNDMLIEVMFRGATEIAEKMINDGGYDLNEVGLNGWPPLLEAIRFGHTDIVELLLAKEVETNFMDKNGWMALHEAAYFGYDDIINLLLNHGADVSIKNERGFTPLHVATLGGFSSSVKILIENGAYVDEQDNHLRTPLHIASEQGYLDVVTLLLQFNANLSIKDEENKLPRDVAEQWGHLDIVNVLK